MMRRDVVRFSARSLTYDVSKLKAVEIANWTFANMGSRTHAKCTTNSSLKRHCTSAKDWTKGTDDTMLVDAVFKGKGRLNGEEAKSKSSKWRWIAT